ncbi:IL-6 subfamily cytokine M17 [Lampris incognitus]|uniref:IL-6 subfamily cytokine M17 n=1 Tax=Lampris incognitus TaxID=2546036 RepID=UPI0024B51FA9|nr:IL-6 subfamily cytokine M17 [Lampris incognitus]
MNGHVKNMYFQLSIRTATTLLSLLLVMAVGPSKTITLCKNQQSGNSLQQTLKLTRLIYKESVDLLRIYKISQGDMSELFCKISNNDVPEPDISGLDPSERIASIYTHLQAFDPHFKRVFEQQTDLQLPPSALLKALSIVSNRSSSLTSLINCMYQSLFPNLPLPEPAWGPTSLPPSQNIFQQKVYGCIVLKRYKEFLSNAAKELRILKSQVCRKKTQMNVVL